MLTIKAKKFYILIIFLVLIFSACDEPPPIPQEKFLEVYADLLIVQDTTTVSKFSLDSAKTLVLSKHNVTLEKYNANIEYYNSRPEKWIEFFDSATAYVDRLKLEAESQP